MPKKVRRIIIYIIISLTDILSDITWKAIGGGKRVKGIQDELTTVSVGLFVKHQHGVFNLKQHANQTQG